MTQTTEPESAAPIEHGVTEGAQEWESLAANGVIPMSWVDNPARCFLFGVSQEAFHWFPHPISARHALAMSENVQHVIDAEAIVRQLLRSPIASIEQMVWVETTRQRAKREESYRVVTREDYGSMVRDICDAVRENAVLKTIESTNRVMRLVDDWSRLLPITMGPVPLREIAALADTGVHLVMFTETQAFLRLP